MELRTDLAKALLLAYPDAKEAECTFLDGIESPELQRAYFVCLIYKMPLKTLKGLAERNASKNAILEERNKHIVSEGSNRDELNHQAQEKLSQVDEVMKKIDGLQTEFSKQSEKISALVANNVDSLKDQIRMYREREDGFKARIEEYERKVAELKAKAEEDSYEERRQRLLESYPGRSDCEPEGFFEKRRVKKYYKDLAAFMKNLDENKDLSKAQRDFLISQIEKGEAIALVSKVVYANLTVDQMERFIRIYKKRGEKR